MKLIPDTHIWLWELLEPERLTPTVYGTLQAPENELWLSPVSVREAVVLVEPGRLRITGSPAAWVEQMLQALPRREAPLKQEIASVSRQLTLSHQDSADRFIAAAASVMGQTLGTPDERLPKSAEYSVLPN